MKKKFTNGFYLLSLLTIVGCADDVEESVSSENMLIDLYGDIQQEYLTRANDAGFAGGDQMGIYIVDYVEGNAGTLAVYDNRADNVAFTMDGTTGRWSSSAPIYWKDKNTAIDVYGYYPYSASIESVNSNSFTVEADQSQKAANGEMATYEKSDFLWAQATDIQPTTEPIQLKYTHRMAGVKVILQQGTGFEGEEWTKVKHAVTVDGTVRKSRIDLVTGTVTPEGTADKNIIAAPQGDDVYRAVVVPQIVEAGRPLIGMTIDGESYHYSPTDAIHFRSSKLYTFTLKVDKREGGDYTLSLVSNEITEWENDATSHSFESAAYTVVYCPKEGTLAECIAKAGKDVSTIQNMKIVGRMNDKDFQFIREQMPVLQGLNLGEVVSYGTFRVRYNASSCPTRMWDYIKDCTVIIKEGDFLPVGDNVLPEGALRGKKSLKHLVLPSSLEYIEKYALSELELSYNSTLVIPNRVKTLGNYALWKMSNCSIVMSDSLIAIGNYAMADQTARYEIVLPQSLQFIDRWAFQNSYNAYGNFSLPKAVKYIGYDAFSNFGHELTGDIEIPEKVLWVDDGTFSSMGFAGSVSVKFHDNLMVIGGFEGLSFNNYVKWPANLKEIRGKAFSGCKFLGGIQPFPDGVDFGSFVFRNCRFPQGFSLPANLTIVPNHLLDNCRGIYELNLPENVESIENNAFWQLISLKRVKLGKYVDQIDEYAFQYCDALTQLTCLAPEPPQLGIGVFDGCDMDHLILEVPEQSVNKYRMADGWNKFKYITAYHELATNLKEIKCLDKGISREMIIRSEGEWTVTQCPDWCHPSQMSSDIRTTVISIKVDPSQVARQGEIVFTLNGKNYTTTCAVEQFVADYPEDKEIVLQQATAGAAPIPVFIVGDGFTADQIADGTYLEHCKQQMESFFAIEPFKSYRNYFSVSTALSVSPELGISTTEYPIKNRFETTADPSVGYRCDYDAIRKYVLNTCQSIDNNNVKDALIMVVMNQNTFGGNVHIDNDGMTIAMTTLSPDSYPYDTRGLVQHYAGGAGFGRLADESVRELEFIKQCSHYSAYLNGKAKDRYQNVSTSYSMNSVPWKHLIFDSRYSDIVDIYEGGFYHSRGMYRSEPSSCMSNFIPYYNTWSRELIVRRIMQLAGKPFDFESFVSQDSREGCPE